MFKPITERSKRNRVITFDAHLETEARFSKVPKLYGHISGDLIVSVFMKRRGLVVRNSAVILIFIPFKTYDKDI